MSLVVAYRLPALLYPEFCFFFVIKCSVVLVAVKQVMLVILHWAGPVSVFTYDMDSQVRPL